MRWRPGRSGLQRPTPDLLPRSFRNPCRTVNHSTSSPPSANRHAAWPDGPPHRHTSAPRPARRAKAPASGGGWRCSARASSWFGRSVLRYGKTKRSRDPRPSCEGPTGPRPSGLPWPAVEGRDSRWRQSTRTRSVCQGVSTSVHTALLRAFRKFPAVTKRCTDADATQHIPAYVVGAEKYGEFPEKCATRRCRCSGKFRKMQHRAATGIVSHTAKIPPIQAHRNVAARPLNLCKICASTLLTPG